MRAVCRDSRLHRWPLWHSRRHFQVIQRGHDKPQESLYDKLGFAKDNEAHRVRRDTTELQQGLLRQVEKLRDPEKNPADQKRLEELKEAYTLLHDDNFRTNYASHYYASNDARLHVLCDGGQVAANFNPEHQQFTYVDHAIDRGSSSSSTSAGSLGSGTSRTTNATAGGMDVPTADALRDAYRNATGVGASSAGATSATAQAFNAAAAAGPLNGTDISHLLRVSLEQSLGGCEAEVELHKHVKCASCRGSGRQRLSKPRRCPQCLGRGSTHMPSATYHIERRCLYCGGEGTVPAPACRSCEGRGVVLNTPVRMTVCVPPGTLTNSLFRLRHHGHDGVRGGHSGDLLVTVLVSEHRYFYRDKEKANVLHAMLPLPLSVALLGGRVEVPTLAGRGVLQVPPCVRNGQMLPYRVYGVAPGEGVEGSELIFHALVMIPRLGDLSGRQREALGVYEAAAGDGREETLKNVTELKEESEETDNANDDEAEPAVSGESREELMQACAALKTTYKHWFTST